MATFWHLVVGLPLLLWSHLLTSPVSAESIQCEAGFNGGNTSNGIQSVIKPRVFIFSDILNEPDDSMSLIRLLLYSNHLDIRGLCATTSTFLRNETHPEEMTRILQVYGTVVGNLNHHVSQTFQYSSSDVLLPLVSSGPKVYGMEALNTSLSEGAKQLIEKLQESSEPLYVSLWGGAGTLAQALKQIETDQSSEDAARLRSRLRVYAISDQDGTGSWIQARWPDILYITSINGFNEFEGATWVGINTDDNGFANTTKIKNAWADENIRVGPLGSIYPQILYGMEGDSPSFLWLISNGLSVPDMPNLGSWGGRYTRVSEVDGFNWYGNAPDSVSLPSGSLYRSSQATVWRWRDAMQDDFAARMQWTLNNSVSAVAHPPQLSINGSTGTEVVRFDLSLNGSIILDAASTCDADHPGETSQLDFEWFGYPPPLGFGVQPSLTILPLTPPLGTNGILSLNEAGFANVTLGPKVHISPPIEVGSATDGEEWNVVLQTLGLQQPQSSLPYPGADPPLNHPNSRQSSIVEEEEEEFTYPDGGTTAWLQVLASHLINQIAWGYPSSYGVYQLYYTTTLNLPSSQASWIGSIQIFLTFGICALSGRLADAGYTRHAVIVGLFMAVMGTFLTSFCHAYWQIFLAQGFCTGLGMGIMFMPGITIVGSYFKRRKTLALSIVTTGTGLGSVTFPILLNYTMPHVGFAWAVRCQALMMLVLGVIAIALMRPRLAPRKKGPLVEWGAFRERSYTCFAIGSFFVFLSLYFSLFYMNVFAREVIGLSFTDSVSLLLILNSSGIPSRVLSGFIAGRYLGSINMFIISNVVVSGMYFAWIGVHTSPGLYVLSVFFGIANGFVQGVFTPALASLTVDPTKMGARFGMIATIVGVASLAGPPIAGAILDVSGGKYIWAQIWAAVITLLGVGSLVAARIAAVGNVLRAKV
ncbi:major facilitator superfamily transporter [Colletotrichum scovillei]|uniref:Major facilitator superfamily transporter n=1 Tax=Colletotrichum scovillei TaxID=1209932 RepID=A0A9P7UH13_9PEZI|nr:major facilitator superfamily transporter [Colletotrichum scovillei]KAG7071326.1 major facilitator superfamily transporter [Colletotrichum scovillei]KAG7079641.1 major facilitator superfamily transporter [Colletotrichum scovillei]